MLKFKKNPSPAQILILAQGAKFLIIFLVGPFRGFFPQWLAERFPCSCYSHFWILSASKWWRYWHLWTSGGRLPFPRRVEGESADALLGFHWISISQKECRPGLPGALFDFMARIAIFTSCKVKGFARCSCIGFWSILASDSIDRLDGRFSRSLKYSFHLHGWSSISEQGGAIFASKWCCCWCTWTKHSLEFFVKTTVVGIGEVLKFVCFITPPVVLHFSKLSLNFATNLLMSVR